MKIQIDFTEKEDAELKKTMMYLNEKTKRTTLKSVVSLFLHISKKYDKLILEKKILLDRIKQLNKYIKYNE